jgi:hypothetical protein
MDLNLSENWYMHMQYVGFKNDIHIKVSYLFLHNEGKTCGNNGMMETKWLAKTWMGMIGNLATSEAYEEGVLKANNRWKK